MSEALQKGPAVRLAMVGVATMLLGGCADSSRMGDPFADPFRTSSSRYDRSPTGSTTQAPPQSQGSNFFAETFRPFDDHPAPAPQPTRAPDYERPHVAPPMAVQSQPLAPPQSIASRPIAAPRPVLAQPVEPTFRPAPAPSASIMRTGPSSVGGWSAEGGVPVVVAQGETAEMIATRYGVPTATLLSLNGYASRAQVQPGSRLVIPVYHAGGAQHAVAAPAQPRPAQTARLEAPKPAQLQAPAPVRQARAAIAPQPQSLSNPTAALAEKRASLAQAKAQETNSRMAKADADARTAQVLADAKKLADGKKLADAKKLNDAKKLAAAKPAAPKQLVASVAPVQPAPVQPVQQAITRPAKQAVVEEAAPATTASVPPPAMGSASQAADSANPEFRWPARGRVIQAFGAGGNDGINIAVPEGTQVKAAEGGKVVYSGSELKGYGNLVLIQHPNGFVSAYANNGSLNVKRGDTVKRGQTIALSGQTGNVASPQLHFELRKGQKPVDPSSYLAGL